MSYQTQETQRLQPRRSNKPLIIALVAVFVVGNAVAGIIYLSKQKESTNPVLRSNNTEEVGKGDGSLALARAKRVQGLNALEKNEFADAKRFFQEAIQMSGGDGPKDLPELAKIATELSGKVGKSADANKKELAAEKKERAAAEKKLALAKKQADEKKSAAEREREEKTLAANKLAASKLAEKKRLAAAQALRKAAKKRAQQRRARVARAPESEPEPLIEPEPEPDPEPETGYLLVTSTPSGLSVVVDGTTRGPTPIRVTLEEGEHQVKIRKGDRTLSTQTATIRSNRIFTVDRDLSDKLQPAPPVVVEKKEPTPPPSEPETATTYGRLSIASPNLHGEVWVDGSRKGFPPLQVQKISTGIHRIEIRVDGVKRKSKVVRVTETGTTKVRF